MSTVVLVILALAFFARGRRGRGAESVPAVLASAEAAGIITAAQREQILTHAAATGASSSRLGGAAWLGVFAGLFVAAGVSLLIARNWEEFGPLLRIVAFLGLLLAVGEGAIRTRERALGISLLLEILWLILPLLGIGLYAQTFQLSGEPIRPFLVWLALTAPLAWLSPRPWVATIHTFALIAVLFTGNFVLEPAGLLIGGAFASPGMLALTGEDPSATAWGLSLLLLAAIVMQSLRLLPRSHRHHCVGVVAIWVFVVLVASTPLRVQHEGWIVIAAVALSTLWIVALTAMETSLEERGAAVAMWLATLYGLTFTWHMHEVADGTASTGGLMIIGAAVIAALGGLLVLPASRLSPFSGWAGAAKAMLLLPLMVAFLYLGSDLRLVLMAAAAMNVILVTIAVGLMWHGSLAREPLQVNLGVLVLVGMLITRFLDVFGNMLRSGIGFIVAGILLAALSLALERTRRRLIGPAREVAG
jgi:uncharacterized membrane protein